MQFEWRKMNCVGFQMTIGRDSQLDFSATMIIIHLALEPDIPSPLFFFYIFFLLEDQGVAHMNIHIPLLQLLNQSKGFKRYYLPLANKGSTFLILDFCSFTCKFCLNPHHWSRHLEKKKKKVVKPLEEQTFVV